MGINENKVFRNQTKGQPNINTNEAAIKIKREKTWSRFYAELVNDPNPKTFWQKNNSWVTALRHNEKLKRLR